MSDIYGFREGPSYRPMSQADFWQSALDQPLSAASTFGTAAKGGALDSFGLGTIARDLMTPSGNDAPQPTGNAYVDTVQKLDDLIAPRNVIKRFTGTMDRSQPAMTEDAWKSSAYYRDGLPYDPAMTEQRAASLAYQYDQRKVRDFYTQKRPITSFLGQFAGQAADPINYIPIFGPEVKAAALAKAGNLLGETLVGAGEAAANTGVFGAVTAGTRAKFGDDVSWQAMLSDMAMAGLIGGVAPHVFRGIGAVAGKGFDTFRERFTDRASTLENVQQGRLALNEAVDGMVHDSEVKLGPNSTDGIAKVVRDIPAEFRPGDNAVAQDKAGNLLPIGGGAVPDTGFAPANVYADGKVYVGAPGETAAALKDRYAAQGDPVSTGFLTSDGRLVPSQIAKGAKRAKAATVETPVLQDASQQPVSSGSSLERTASWVIRDKTTKQVVMETYDPKKVERLNTAKYEAVPIGQYLGELNTLAHATAQGGQQPPIDATTPRPEPLPAERQTAEARIAKPEDAKALADQYRVDPQTGDFPELASIENLKAQGRLTEDDARALDEAASDFEKANAWGEALKSVVNCLL